MLLNELKEGMKIRISKNPIISIKNFGGETAKLKMAGKVKIIRIIERKQNAILVRDDRRELWTIHIDDIRSIESLPLIKPQIFDPNQFVL